jgi:hypothetical protein
VSLSVAAAVVLLRGRPHGSTDTTLGRAATSSLQARHLDEPERRVGGPATAPAPAITSTSEPAVHAPGGAGITAEGRRDADARRRGSRPESPESTERGSLDAPRSEGAAPGGASAIVRTFPENEAKPASRAIASEAVRSAAPAPSSQAADVNGDERSEQRAARERQAREDAQRAADDRLQREMDELIRAKRALASDPRLALELARHGEREFHGSLLSEERQHVLLLSLIALGRTEEAARLAAPYLAKHPNSPFARRVRAALDARATRHDGP